LLEYDRNKGVEDAVLKSFSLSTVPSINKIFLGSKSAGGHTTYHDDVIGGDLTMTFSGEEEDYSLRVPWRYDDTQQRYSQIATRDRYFELVLDEPYRTPKILVMQSPGLPAPVDGQVLAGPYLVRGVGILPNLTGQLTMRLPQAEPEAKLVIFNGQTWQTQEDNHRHITDHIITATVPLALKRHPGHDLSIIPTSFINSLLWLPARVSPLKRENWAFAMIDSLFLRESPPVHRGREL
jgi:hypothetical protein